MVVIPVVVVVVVIPIPSPSLSLLPFLSSSSSQSSPSHWCCYSGCVRCLPVPHHCLVMVPSTPLHSFPFHPTSVACSRGGGAVLPGCCAGTVPVPLVVITLCHLVSNNKMKRLHTFLPAEVGALRHSFWSSSGCSQAPLCIIAISFLLHFLTHVAVALPSTILHL